MLRSHKGRYLDTWFGQGDLELTFENGNEGKGKWLDKQRYGILRFRLSNDGTVLEGTYDVVGDGGKESFSEKAFRWTR